MRTDAHAVRPMGSHTVLPRTRLSLAVVQLCVIGALGWLGATGDSDATATSVDWAFVGFAMAIPLSLAVSCWAGWMLQQRSSPGEPRVIRYVARVAQWITLGLLVISLATAPFAILGAIVFGPMG